MVINLLCMSVFIIACSSWNFSVTQEYFDKHAYITDHIGNTATEVSLQAIISFYLLFNYLIPLDLAVMIEFNAI